MKSLFEMFNRLLDFAERRAAALLVLAMVCFGSAFAVPFVADKFSSIIVRPGNGVEDSNGVFRAYMPNGTNYLQLGTNGVWTLFGSTKTWTGFTGSLVTSNNIGGYLVTNQYIGGIHFGTNLTVAAGL